MSGFCPPEKEFIEKYEQEAPHCAPVEHKDRNSRYEKDAYGNYCCSTGAADDSATIICAGDMLCEEKMYKAHYDGARYCFHDVFSFIRPEFKNADLVIGNLETTICESYPYTGEQYKVDGKYHCNAPAEFLDAIREAGFDLLTLANNHCVDTGFAGAMETLHRIDERGMMRTGLFRPEDDRRFCMAEVNDIRVAVLSYSTWFNRNQNRLTERGRAEIINEYEPEKVRRDVQAAKEAGAEFVLVYIHWGIDAEYKNERSASMEKQAQEIADAGADYIVGSHTHSVQEYDRILSADGRVVPVMYSVGNFVTSEMNPISRETVVLKLRLRKSGEVVHVAAEELIPCYVPDSLYGIAYPIVPETAGIGGGPAEKLTAAFSHVRSVVGERWKSVIPFMTARNMEQILGLEPSGMNVVCTTLNFAMDARKNGAAIVSEITSDPTYRTSEKRCIELADLAVKKGAKLLISAFQIKDYPCLVTEDVFAAYVKIIKAYRSLFTPYTVSITGSIGKTTSTEMVRAMLLSRYNTHYNTGSANNVRYSGTVIQQLKPEHEVYVQETMEGPPYGAGSTIAQMVRPNAAIVTVVGTSHMEAFGSQERIAESCLGVQDGMPEDGLLILNGDDPFQRDAKTARRTVYYGIANEAADYRAVNIRGEKESMVFDVLYGGKQTEVRIHCFGRHNVLNALAAFAVGEDAGMTEKEIAAGLARYRTSGIRQNLVSFGGYRLYLDCYNAAPESIQSALDTFAMIPVPEDGRRIAVLADVAELGEQTVPMHKRIGEIAAASCADLLICYGENAGLVAETVRSKRDIPVFHTVDRQELIGLLKATVTRNDVTLFKGSHSMELEHVVDLVWGTWFHEEFERYDFLTRDVSDEELKYKVYTDHVAVTGKRSTTEQVIVPGHVEGKPVTSVSPSAFSGSQYTKFVAFPETMRNIRYCAFYKAANLESVHIPASVRIIHDSAFSTCGKLREAVIEPGCMHLGYRAFGNCKNLETVVIPATVRQIGNEAFLNCAKLTVYGEAGSYAEAYAKARNIRFSTSLPESVTTHTHTHTTGKS